MQYFKHVMHAIEISDKMTCNPHDGVRTSGTDVRLVYAAVSEGDTEKITVAVCRCAKTGSC